MKNIHDFIMPTYIHGQPAAAVYHTAQRALPQSIIVDHGRDLLHLT